MSRKSSSLYHYRYIRIEGFEQQHLLSHCLRHCLLIRNLQVESEISMTCEILNEDWAEFLQLTKKAYRVTVLREYGLRPTLRHIVQHKITLVGILLFFAVLAYQASFIAEIRISGYERIGEAQIRRALADLGLYEGCSKNLDLTDVKTQMYQKLDAISWIGITYKGSMAEVTIVEGTKERTKTDRGIPTNVVAGKDGYIEEVLPKEGLTVVSSGAFVKKGEVVITGVMPTEDKSYTNRKPEELIRLVHADGEVKARVIYRFHCYQEKTEVKKKKTGQQYGGISIRLGNHSMDTTSLWWPYRSSIRKERELFFVDGPIPFGLSAVQVCEVTQTKQIRSPKTVKTKALAQARQFQKENIPETAKILNNSLKFVSKENIIEVTIMIQALEEIGESKELRFSGEQGIGETPEGGTEPIGNE